MPMSARRKSYLYSFNMLIRKTCNILILKFQKLLRKRERREERGKRIPYDDRIFLYILKNSLRYAFIEPKWIVEHGEIGVVDAWGSRLAYRVPKEDFESILKSDESLKPFVETIDAKITILDFQHQLISI